MGRKANSRRRSDKNKKKEIIPEEKTQTEAEPNFPYVPEEIVVDIRLRLPLKSLSRFTCVSKQWHSAIFGIFAQRIGGKVALVESTLMAGDPTFHSIDEECRVKRVPRPWNNKSRWSKYPTIIGSCNGLLLMFMHDDLFLWNPVTKYFKKVLSYEPLGDEGFRIASGLCYDSSAQEYKAVMVFSPENHNSEGRFAVVGSFRSNSWRRVRCPYSVFQAMKSGPVTYEFHEVPMPKPPPNSAFQIRGLGVLDGCLCMIRKNSNNNFEVLAMKKFGIRESWTKMFVMIPNMALRLATYSELLGYTKCGEVLMKVSVDDMRCEITTHNPMDSSHQTIPIQDGCHYVNAVMYEETMVTPTDYDWEEKELRGEATYVEYFLNRPPQKMRKRRDGIWEVCTMEKKNHSAWLYSQKYSIHK